MNRRLPVALVAAALVAAGTVPAVAAKPKPKPKPITGSYTVELYPDPSPNATSLLDEGATCGVLPTSVDARSFTFPAAGTLTVDLVSADPIPANEVIAGDWDLYVLEGGNVRSSSTTGSGTEHTVDKLKKKTALTFEVCNLNGAPKATVSYRFVYA